MPPYKVRIGSGRLPVPGFAFKEKVATTGLALNTVTQSHLLARAAVTTCASNHSVYYLNETQDEFNCRESQEDRK